MKIYKICQSTINIKFKMKNVSSQSNNSISPKFLILIYFGD